VRLFFLNHCHVSDWSWWRLCASCSVICNCARYQVFRLG
jgi:hypothetical protein